MASPFAVFRRNQRVMIAVLGVITILLFVIGDPISKMIGGQSAQVNPVVVKTNYGNYKRSELSAIEQQRKWLEIFLQRVVGARVEKEMAGKQIDRMRLQMYATRLYNYTYQQLMGRMHPPGDAATLETIVLAKRAEEMGMVASDQAVSELLRSLAGEAFPQLRDIIAGLKPDGKIPISQSYLFDGLQREILASKYSQLFQIGMFATPPGERWNYFEQLNLKADAQVLPVKVEQFLAAVPDPSDAKVQDFFERHKNRLPQPLSPDPGFKEPLKIAFQYFTANFEKTAERVSGQVTPEEMHEYYEKNKAIQFRQGRLPPGKPQPEGPAGAMEDPLGPDEPSDGATKPEAENPAAGDSKPETDDSKPATDAKPATGDSEPASTDATPDATKKAPVAPANPPASAKPAVPAGKKSSQVEPRSSTSPFRLASAPQPGAADKKPAADKPAADEPAEDKSPDADSAAGERPQGDDAAKAPAAGEDQPADDAGEKKDEQKYEPFEKVESTIRELLARDKARNALDEAFEKLSVKVHAYASARRTYLRERETDTGAKPPAKLDLAALADEFGVTAHQTDLISAYEAETATDLGKSFTVPQDPQMGYRQISFVQMAYGDGTPESRSTANEYRPASSFDSEGTRFLWWETNSAPEGVPALDSVRDKVVHALKMIEARELALKQANAYAKEASQAKQPLAEVFKGREGLQVTDTGLFTRLTMGNTAYDPESSQPHMSPVHGVEAAGVDFMNACFGASPGDVKVALDQSQDVAYVIQVQKFSPDRDLLEHEFILEPFQKYGQIARDQQQRFFVNWIETLDQEAGIDWIEPPNVSRRGEE